MWSGFINFKIACSFGEKKITPGFEIKTIWYHSNSECPVRFTFTEGQLLVKSVNLFPGVHESQKSRATLAKLVLFLERRKAWILFQNSSADFGSFFDVCKFNATAIFGLLLGEEQVLPFFWELAKVCIVHLQLETDPWPLVCWVVVRIIIWDNGTVRCHYWLLKCKAAGHNDVQIFWCILNIQFDLHLQKANSSLSPSICFLGFMNHKNRGRRWRN